MLSFRKYKFKVEVKSNAAELLDNLIKESNYRDPALIRFKPIIKKMAGNIYEVERDFGKTFDLKVPEEVSKYGNVLLDRIFVASTHRMYEYYVVIKQHHSYNNKGWSCFIVEGYSWGNALKKVVRDEKHKIYEWHVYKICDL